MELQEGQSVRPEAAPEIAVESAPVNAGTEIVSPDHSFGWEASEYVFHEKSALWELGLFVIAGLIVAALALFHQWFGVGVVAVMALAVAVYSRKAPRVLQYHLDEHGLTIQGKFNAYTAFRSYSVQQDVAWRAIDLEPAKRFVPRLTILCENDDFDTIEGILAEHLPRHDRHPDVIERLTRYLKF